MEATPVLRTASPRAGRRALDGNALQPVLDKVETDLGESLHLADMAMIVGLSKFHFCREFRRVIGSSPYAYLKRRRIARACLLLAGSTANISDIATQVGFKTHAHFTKAFVDVAKMTPRSYRARHNGTADSPAGKSNYDPFSETRSATSREAV